MQHFLQKAKVQYEQISNLFLLKVFQFLFYLILYVFVQCLFFGEIIHYKKNYLSNHIELIFFKILII